MLVREELQAEYKEVIETVVRFCQPDRIILYGSRVKRNARPDSDLDLLVVMETDLPRAFRAKPIRQLFYDSPVRVDMIVYTPAELEEQLRLPYSFLSSIMKSGVEVYRG